MNLKNKNKLLSIIKWGVICLFVGILSGSASALFLVSLDWVTHFRENYNWIIWLLPVAGLSIGLLYHYYGKEVEKGNDLLLEEYENPHTPIPFKMLPLIFSTTLITHLFGGSAGREGTAIQMGGAIADQFTTLFNLSNTDRKTIIILGISAGFASVFGTPLAGALFALEVLFFSQINFKGVILSFVSAYIAYFTVEYWNVKHTLYTIGTIPKITFEGFIWVILMGILFGLTALLFSKTTRFWKTLFKKSIKYPPLRPFMAGIAIASAVYFMGTTKYIGLGIPTLVDSFSNPNTPYDFLLKILFTGFTLGAGFKGGEVTPLFFVGATLGSALSLLVPLPIALLAGMGFVAVFAGATHTPVACTVMGMELFGIESGIYIAIACLIAYFSSGSEGIYQSQKVKGAKYKLYQKVKEKIALW